MTTDQQIFDAIREVQRDLAVDTYALQKLSAQMLKHPWAKDVENAAKRLRGIATRLDPAAAGAYANFMGQPCAPAFDAPAPGTARDRFRRRVDRFMRRLGWRRIDPLA